MRILVAMLSVGFAGTERHAVDLANELCRQGHEVAMLLRRRPAEAHRQAAYETLRRGISPGISIFLASRATPVFALWRALIAFRPDIIHGHHERAIRLTSRYSGRVPRIGTIHTHFKARDFARCDGLICLTRAEEDRIPKSYQGVVRVISNWVLPHPRPRDRTLSLLRAEFGVAAEDYVIGTVARLEPIKGLAELIVAFHAAGLPDARLMIVGEGNQRSDLEYLIAKLGLRDRVILTGFRQDVRDIYFLFDLFVLTAVDEPYGLVIIEAAASGLPVVATVSPGPAMIAESLRIELVPNASADLLVAALHKMYRRPAPDYDMSGFAVEAKVHAIVTAYQDVIAAKRGRPRSAA